MNTEIITISSLVGASAIAITYFRYQKLKNKFSVKFYEEGILYRNGKFEEILEAGNHHYFWGGYGLIKVDKRIAQLVIQPQEIFTQDQISIKVSGVVQYQVVDARKYTEKSEEPLIMIYSMVQLALRDAVSEMRLEELNTSRNEIAKRAILNLAEKSLEIGIEVKQISVRDLIFPSDIKSAYHDAICAQKKSLAKLESARGEVAAARAMANASKQYAQNPEMMQLRYLEVLKSAADTQGNTFILNGVDEMPKMKLI